MSSHAVERAEFSTHVADAVFSAKGAPLCLLVFDVDELTALNSEKGESAGDEVLHQLRRVLERTFGEGEIARIDGDRFAALARGRDLEKAQQDAAAVRAFVAVFGATVSCGVAQRRAGEPALNLLEAAEFACEKAKMSGRNAVVAR